MIEHKAALLSGLMILLLTAMGLACWSLLPAGQMIATHFAEDGAPDRWIPPSQAFLFGPVIAALTWGTFFAVRRMDPKRAEGPAKAEAMIFYAPVILIGCMQGFFISHAFGLNWTNPKIILIGIALMWMMLGNVMGKLPHNHAFGFRTPWTLADPHIWDQCNRFGGQAMVLAGLGAIALALMLNGWPMLIGTAAMPMVAILSTMAKSWLLWRRRHPDEGTLPRNGTTLQLVLTVVTLVAMVADFALEQGHSVMPISLVALAAMLTARYLYHRHQRH